LGDASDDRVWCFFAQTQDSLAASAELVHFIRYTLIRVLHGSFDSRRDIGAIARHLRHRDEYNSIHIPIRMSTTAKGPLFIFDSQTHEEVICIPFAPTELRASRQTISK
jgi:hypothetical protein